MPDNYYSEVNENGVVTPLRDLAAFPRSEQAVLGAKNLLDIESANSFSNAKVENKSIVNTNTDSRAANFWVGIRKGTTLVQTLLTLQTLSAVGEYEFRITIPSNADYNNLYIGHNGTNNDMKVGIPFSGYGDYIISFNATGVDSSTVGGYVLTKVMVRLASDPDPTYARFAMTNRELTDEIPTVTDIKADCTSSVATINSLLISKVGKMAYISGVITLTSNVSAGGELIALPTKYAVYQTDGNSGRYPLIGSNGATTIYYLFVQPSSGTKIFLAESANSGASIRFGGIYLLN